MALFPKNSGKSASEGNKTACPRIHWKCARAVIAGIPLVDKFLILFMLVLLCQSAYSLFFQTSSSSETSTIDVIVRTASASIFGYLLSANFGRHSQSNTAQASTGTVNTEISSSSSSTEIRGQIGFLADSTDSSLETGQALSSPTATTSAGISGGRIQVIAASVIGLFCLISLIVLRNFPQWVPGFLEESTVSATVAQFRDFVSGCVGFLISCPASHTQKAP